MYDDPQAATFLSPPTQLDAAVKDDGALPPSARAADTSSQSAEIDTGPIRPGSISADPRPAFEDKPSDEDQGSSQPPAWVSEFFETEGLQHGQCRNCKQVNDSDRNFCGNCGYDLREPCLGCDSPIRASERFCPDCGADIGELEAKCRLEHEQRRQTIESSVRNFQFDDAIRLVKTLADLHHPRFAEVAKWARSRLD